MWKSLLAITLILILQPLILAQEPGKRKPAPGWSPAVDLAGDASTSWMLKQLKRGGKVFANRDYVFAEVPGELDNGTLLLRDYTYDWLEPKTLRARKSGKVFAIVRWKFRGEEELSQLDFARFKREGWKESPAEVVTTFPNGQDWRWKTLRRDIKQGDVVLQLKTISWSDKVVLFVFKEESDQVVKSEPKPGAQKSSPTAISLTAKAPSDWLLKEAKPGAPIFSDRKYFIESMPQEMVGGTIVCRSEEGSETWLAPGTFSSATNLTVYAVVRVKRRDMEQISEVTLNKLGKEGWQSIPDVIETTFPNGEDWQWQVLRKNIKKREISIHLKNVPWREATVFFVFKDRK